MDQVGINSGVIIEVQGASPELASLITSAVNYGLSKCGFDNVMIADTEEVTSHPADALLLPFMRNARRENPELFAIEVDMIPTLSPTPDEEEFGGQAPSDEDMEEDAIIMADAIEDDQLDNDPDEDQVLDNDD